MSRLATLEIERSQLRQMIEKLKLQMRHMDREAEALRRIIGPEDLDGRYGPRGGQWLEAAYHLMCGEGRPLHYRELLGMLRDEGYEIGGTAAEANLVTRLNRDRRFRRVGRGMYVVEPCIDSVDECATGDEGRQRVSELVGFCGDAVANGERRRAQLRHVRESVEVEIAVVSAAIRQLRTGAQRGVVDISAQDPFVAIPALERRLTRLLQQRESLNHQRASVEAQLQRLRDGTRRGVGIEDD